MSSITHGSGRRSARGFTLMELMVVVAIVGILAAIAVPSYNEQVRKSRRADAKTQVMEIAQGLHRFFTVRNRFTGGPCPIPDNDFYNIQCVLDDLSFTITATPVEGTPQEEDRCGALVLDNADRRTVVDAELTAQECW